MLQGRDMMVSCLYVYSLSSSTFDEQRIEEEMNGQTMDNLFQSGKARIVGRTFVSFKGCSNFPVMPVRKEDMDELQVVPGLSLSMPDIKISREEINTPGFGSKLSVSSRSGWSSSASNGHQNLKASGQQQSSARKQRRCWSPELHRRFVSALEQLGGAQVATPKQIRELMQVDGLTNDEVKSHLQKYRIHTQKSTNANVKLGNLWMSHEKCPESSKHSNPESGSPEGPLQLSWGDSMEDHEYEKPESHHNWKGNNNIQLSVRD